ncbi:hypothetical protein BCR42DRAFT_411413 [Absidia repens]|uniref:Uncharacterized protein n=1 Tax=Absidia repens TaxID=90262 RepID=A0A1X2ILM9_9FUNG|nr:hypothetical protein BCR42DRAFT_411413 [Absidia repens]
MMKKVLTSTPLTRRTLITYHDYLPWANEHCTVGSTYDVIINGENKADRVCVSKYAIDTDFMWENSSANSVISEVSKHVEEPNMYFYLDKPSTAHFQSKHPPPREGLFKAAKKQSFKRLP